MAKQDIMIVDDDDDIRNTLKEFLELFGYSVSMASNGKEALELLKNNDAPCLLLLDLMMPVMNGWELLDTLQSEFPDAFGKLPIIVISAAADVSNIQEQYGCQVMGKPLNLKQVTTLANRYCTI